ncbi:hypothetical protein AB0O82_21085 [Kitasatospora sp. NPDC088264]|uniref:hypothetical protein n=1 Tax=Kitasatospora sp. NPDC088264 TaxID=3155296 RepID=UPI003435E71E
MHHTFTHLTKIVTPPDHLNAVGRGPEVRCRGLSPFGASFGAPFGASFGASFGAPFGAPFDARFLRGQAAEQRAEEQFEAGGAVAEVEGVLLNSGDALTA